jgi:hypothetical protein
MPVRLETMHECDAHPFQCSIFYNLQMKQYEEAVVSFNSFLSHHLLKAYFNAFLFYSIYLTKLILLVDSIPLIPSIFSLFFCS